MEQLKLRKRVPYHGELLTFVEIAARTGATEVAVHCWYKRHKTMDGFDARHDDLNIRKTKQFIKSVPFHGQMMTYGEIAIETGEELEHVRRWFSRHGTMDGFEERHKNWYRNRKRNIVSFHGKDMTYDEIGKELGVSTKLIRLWCWKHDGSMEGFENRHEIARRISSEKNTKHFMVGNRITTYKELAEEYDVPLRTMMARICESGSPDVDMHSPYTRRDRRIKAALAAI